MQPDTVPNPECETRDELDSWDLSYDSGRRDGRLEGFIIACLIASFVLLVFRSLL